MGRGFGLAQPPKPADEKVLLGHHVVEQHVERGRMDPAEKALGAPNTASSGRLGWQKSSS